MIEALKISPGAIWSVDDPTCVSWIELPDELSARWGLHPVLWDDWGWLG